MNAFTLGAICGAIVLLLLQKIGHYFLRGWFIPPEDGVYRIVNPKLWPVLLDLLVILFFGWLAFRYFDNAQAVTRKDLLAVVGAAVMLFFFVLALVKDLNSWRVAFDPNGDTRWDGRGSRN